MYSAHKTLPQLGLTNSISVTMTARCVVCGVAAVTAAAGTRHGAIADIYCAGGLTHTNILPHILDILARYFAMIVFLNYSIQNLKL